MITEELVRKHRKLIEARVTVRAHPSHSKKGKAFNVKQYDRNVDELKNATHSVIGQYKISPVRLIKIEGNNAIYRKGKLDYDAVKVKRQWYLTGDYEYNELPEDMVGKIGPHDGKSGIY